MILASGNCWELREIGRVYMANFEPRGSFILIHRLSPPSLPLALRARPLRRAAQARNPRFQFNIRIAEKISRKSRAARHTHPARSAAIWKVSSIPRRRLGQPPGGDQEQDD